MTKRYEMDICFRSVQYLGLAIDRLSKTVLLPQEAVWFDRIGSFQICFVCFVDRVIFRVLGRERDHFPFYLDLRACIDLPHHAMTT
jgi:hypothetical protein